MIASLKGIGSVMLEGFLITLPVLLAYLMLGGVVDGMMALTSPVVDVLPVEWFEGPGGQRWFAVGALIALFLVVGAASHTVPMRQLGVFLESHTLGKFPPYEILKNLSKAVAGRDQSGLRPGLLTVAPGTRMLVAVVEELPGEELCVYVPMAPTPAVGFLQIVDRSKVECLDVPMSDALGSILNWGAGTADLLGGRAARSASIPTSGEPR